MRRADEAAERRDWDAVMSIFAPDAVWDQFGMHVFDGRAAIRGFFEDWFSAFEGLAMETEEALDLGNGVVFSVINQKGRPVGGTAANAGEVRQRSARVGQWSDGLIERVTAYRDINEARTAAERLAEERG